MIKLGEIVTLNQEVQSTSHLVVSIVVLVKILNKPTGWRGKITFRDTSNGREDIHDWVSMNENDGGISVISRGISDSAEKHEKTHHAFRFTDDRIIDHGIRDIIADWIREHEDEIESLVQRPELTPNKSIKIGRSSAYEIIDPLATKHVQRGRGVQGIQAAEVEHVGCKTINDTVVMEMVKLLRKMEFMSAEFGLLSENNLKSVLAKEGMVGVGSIIRRIEHICNACNAFQSRVSKIIGQEEIKKSSTEQ